MPDAKDTLFVLLALVAVAFVVGWGSWLLRQRARSHAQRVTVLDMTGSPVANRDGERVAPNAWELVVGFLTDFLDTLGVGSFATTTALYRWRRTIADELIPGTLNVGHTLPTIAQAYIYIDAIEVDATTLVAMIVAAVAGSLVGAPIVCRWPRRNVQIGLGSALLALCAVLVFRQFGDPTGGSALGLTGGMLALGVAANFVLGALMTIGVGLYAPCLVLVSLLGMNPKTGFPIMMGSCAFLMPLASIPFIRRGAYSPRAALGLALAGVPAVLIAAFIVRELPLYWVKWLVAAVVVYTSITLLRSAARERSVPSPSTSPL